MGESRKFKNSWVKKTFVIVFITVSLVICLLIFDSYKAPEITDNPEGAGIGAGAGGQVQVVNPPPSSSSTPSPSPAPITPPTVDSVVSPVVEPPPQRPVITTEQRNLIGQTILSNAFVKDLPEKGVIALRFYDFFLGERIWHPDILIGRTGILSSGTPDLVLIMHARYISQLNGGNLCDVIKSANTNGEMWTESQYSDTRLLLKYSSMVKYRDCFGF